MTEKNVALRTAVAMHGVEAEQAWEDDGTLPDGVEDTLRRLHEQSPDEYTAYRDALKAL
jgi:hypothetical protein